MNNKLNDALCADVITNSEFIDDYKMLLKSSIYKNKPLKLSLKQIKRLVESSAIFSLNNKSNFQKLSLKICYMILEKHGVEHPLLYRASEIILSRLGNLPSIEKIYEKNTMPSELKKYNLYELIKFPEIRKKQISNKIIINDVPLSMTDFQSKVYDKLSDDFNVSMSAPTSAGKSFVVCSYIIDKLLKFNTCTIIYLVPSKALIDEIQTDIIKLLKKTSIRISDIMLHNSSEYFKIDDSNNDKKIFILTQERLRNLIKKQPNINIDLLVIDEAQKIKDPVRGPILETVVSELLLINNDAQKIIISPFIDNPDKFLDTFNIKNKKSHISTDVTSVGQNIFFIDTNNKNITISILIPEIDNEQNSKNKMLIDDISIPKKIVHDNEKKAWVLDNFIDHTEQTIIYCDTPHRCKEAIDAILKLDNTEFNPTNILKSGIQFIKNHVHENYFLADCLKFGVGYHHGKMPYFLKDLVKSLFENKEINRLCCTSTLLEGVNLPAKNIILYKPKKSRKDPMDEFTIKNLAGRAGRLRYDYYGNVYCINIDEWKGLKTTNPFNEKLESVESAIDKTYNEKIDQLINNLNLDDQSILSSNIDNVVKNLIVKYLNNSNETIEKINEKYDLTEKDLNDISSSLENIKNRIADIDLDVIFENQTIDPRLQHKLYQHLNEPDNMILPPHIDDPDFEPTLEKILHILNNTFHHIDNFSSQYYALIANNWIKQKSYKQIFQYGIMYNEKTDMEKINKNLKNYTAEEYKNKKLKELNIITNRHINDINDIIENHFKFTLSQSLHCYCSLVKSIIKKDECLIDDINVNYELPFQLEFGAHEKKLLLMLELGLSRTVAIIILNKISINILDMDTLIIWLHDHLDDLKKTLHPYMIDNIKEILQSRSVT